MFLAASLAFAMAQAGPTQLPHDPRMDWWREAKFGMFIHWGLYAVPAGKWGDRDTYGEWIRDSARIPIDTYDQFRGQFNPTKFDADAWVRMAKDAGMKYIVITTKHHDGFSLFDSAVSDFDIMNTPFKRDIMKELAEACRREGIKMCWYHSIMDWHHPDYLPRRGWEAASRPAGNADFNRYNEYLQAQVTELLTKYGDIGIMWFDGQWESTWNPTFGKPLYDLCRRLQPNVIVNNRVYSGPGGGGDYLTPEQEIPAEAIAGKDWETCMTMNRNWGYNAADKAFKSTKEMIQMLADIASKGGNYLMNVGPTAEGLFPEESVQRLKEIGGWMRKFGTSIYGTSASPLGKLPWGRCTVRKRGSGRDHVIYFHVFDWPEDGKLRIVGLGNDVPLRAFNAQHEQFLRAGAGAPPRDFLFPCRREGSDVVIELPNEPLDPMNFVVGIDLKEAPIVYMPPRIEAPSPVFIRTARVALSAGSEELQVRYTVDGTTPNAASRLYNGPIGFSETTTVKARTFHKGRAVSGVAERTFEKVSPWPASNAGTTLPGLLTKAYEGDWDKTPEFPSLTHFAARVDREIGLGPQAAQEHVGLVLEGLLDVPSTDIFVFELGSDDGSKLLIDGKLVVDNDGLHGLEVKRGHAPLARGKHRIRIEWFNKTGGAGLTLAWAKAGDKPVPVRAGALSHPG